MNASTYEPFDIMKMARQVEARKRRELGIKLVASAAFISLGVVRGGVVGALLVGYGVHLSFRVLTGHSPLEHLRTLRARHVEPTSDVDPSEPPQSRSGTDLRDRVDEASWESFPASDPPAHGPNYH